MPYGRMNDGSVKIGSLELLQASDIFTQLNTSDPAMRTGSAGEETAAQIRAEIPDSGYELVIMNPPFTRATNHGGAHSNVVNPIAAAFNANSADQTAMGNRVNRLGDNTCYHGNAGIASAFAALANKKLKPGGVLALVLPLVATTGLSWERFRQLLSKDYTELEVLSIAASDIRDISFSADTGLAECLIVARKLNLGEESTARGRFTSLTNRPQGFAHASEAARGTMTFTEVRRIEDGPYGGTPLTVGEELSGVSISVPHRTDGEGWGAVRLYDSSLGQSAYALAQSRLWLPGNASPVELNMTYLGEIGKLGLVHRDITGTAPRGPFDKTVPSTTATYPSLWSHNAAQETRIVCLPDSQLIVRPGMEDKAADVWATASRAHLNLGFRFNAQPLAIAFTDQHSIGGRAWPNVNFGLRAYEMVLALWGNSTLGILCYWWNSGRQDSGRGDMTIRSAGSLPVLDFRTLTDGQLRKAEAIFNEFRDKELKPAYLADADPNRALLDRRVVCDLLGFDEETYAGVRRLAAKWCAEPSVHGGKARPRGTALVV